MRSTKASVIQGDDSYEINNTSNAILQRLNSMNRNACARESILRAPTLPSGEESDRNSSMETTAANHSIVGNDVTAMLIIGARR